VAIDDKYDRLKQLMDAGKEKGYVLYDEVSELLPDDIAPGPELDDILVTLDGSGVEILEEPKIGKPEEAEELLEVDLTQEFGDKTNDPVRMYLREMGTVPLLTREGEIELAKRIERGQRAVRKSLARSPLITREVLTLGDDVRRDTVPVRDVLLLPDLVASEDSFETQRQELLPLGHQQRMRRRVALARNPIRQVQPRRVFAGHNAGPRWRADRPKNRWESIDGGFSHPRDGSNEPIDWLVYHHWRRVSSPRPSCPAFPTTTGNKWLTVCHCFAEAVRSATGCSGTACAKQWHTFMNNPG